MKVILLLAAVLAGATLHAQDVHFSQFYSTPLLVNPAMTGIFDGKVRVSNNYRSQWSGVGKAYSTFHFSLDLPLGKSRFRKNYFGGGLMIYQDNAGAAQFTHTIIEGALAYTLSFDDGDNYLSIGFRGGLDSRAVDFTKSTWSSQWNGDNYDNSLTGESPQLQQRTYLDLTTGLMWYYIPDGNNSICVGGSYAHVTQPDQSFFNSNHDYLSSRITLHGSAELSMDAYNSFWIAPKFLVQLQGEQSEILAGTFAKMRLQLKSKFTNYKRDSYLSFGAWYRVGDAFILATRFEYKDFGLGISYDMTTSDFSSMTGYTGGPEFALSYISGIKLGQRSKHYNKMPKFF